jgi:hypothetical protein
MRQFAIIKDVSSDKLFAIIVKDDDFTVCHGVHPAGKKWAESYNKGLTKSIYDDLQPGISVGSFAPVTATTQALIDEATEGKPVRFPDYSQLTYVKSVNYRYDGEIPQVKDAGLSNLTDKDFFIGADYKGLAFRADAARLSLLAKARLGHFGTDSKGFNFTEKGTDQKALNEELFQTAQGSGNTRRAAKAVLLEKHLNLEEHPGYLETKEHSSPIRTKANRLGRRIGGRGRGGGGGGRGIRKIGRSMKDPFDPKAWDGDHDGIVQEGTIWERPSIPGVNTNFPGQRRTRTKPRNYPADDADGVEFRLRNRREENRAQDEILNTPVGEVIEDFPEAAEALRNTLSGFSEDDDIWETPLRDITDNGEYFGEDDLDRLLDAAVPRRREGATDSFYRDEQGMRSQRDVPPPPPVPERESERDFGDPPPPPPVPERRDLPEPPEPGPRAPAPAPEPLERKPQLVLPHAGTSHGQMTPEQRREQLDAMEYEIPAAREQALKLRRLSEERNRDLNFFRGRGADGKRRNRHRPGSDAAERGEKPSGMNENAWHRNETRWLQAQIDSANEGVHFWDQTDYQWSLQQQSLREFNARGEMAAPRGMRSERYDITQDEAGKWRVMDTGNRNMRLPEEYDNREDALREAIRRDNPRGGMRSTQLLTPEERADHEERFGPGTRDGTRPLTPEERADHEERFGPGTRDGTRPLTPEERADHEERFGMRSERLRQGDTVTVRHGGEDVEGTVVRYGRGGASGVGTDSYVVDVGEQQSVWKRPDEILEGPDSGGGMRSQSAFNLEPTPSKRFKEFPQDHRNAPIIASSEFARPQPGVQPYGDKPNLAGTEIVRGSNNPGEIHIEVLGGDHEGLSRVKIFKQSRSDLPRDRGPNELRLDREILVPSENVTLNAETNELEWGGSSIYQNSWETLGISGGREHGRQWNDSGRAKVSRILEPGEAGEVGDRPNDRVRNRRGMRSRTRDASVDRASQLQGMRSGGKRRRGQAQPGVDRHSDIDGQIWESLTDAERAHVGTAIDTEMRRRMHGLAWNDMDGIDPRRPKQKKRGDMTPEEELEATFHVNPLGGIVKAYFDQQIRPDFQKDYDGDELAQKLKDYVFTDTDIDTIEAAIESQIEATGDATDKAADQLKDQLREIRVYRNMVEQSDNGKDSDAFRFLEHLTPTQRARIYNRANGADKDRLETSKASWGLSKGNRINSTIGSTFTERQTAIDAVKPGARRRTGEFSRSMAQRIWAPNPNSAYRRALRKARRGTSGSTVPGFRREEDKRSIVARRVAQLRRKLRVVKGRKGIQGAINASEKKQIKKAVDFDADGKLLTSDEGIARLGKASRALLGDKSLLKDVRMKGRGGKGTDGASEDEVEKILNQNPEMAVIWDAMGMNDLPVVVDDDNFEALIDAGHPVIGRGHGSAGNATDYLDDELRFLPGGGGEASGKGEYWSTGGGSWGSWQSTEGGNTVAVLTPNVRRMDGDTLDAESTANRSVSQAFELVRATYPGDELEKADIAEVVSRMDAEIAKITDLAEGAPIWETEVGQLWSHLLDSIRTSGNPDSLNAMLLLNKINNTRGGRNLIAPILGYDTIQSGSVELVMNRSAVITLGRTLGSSGLSQFFKQAADVRSEGRRART